MREYIDRQNLLAKFPAIGDPKKINREIVHLLIASEPTADVQEVRHGRWELVEDLDVCGDKPFRCNNCISDEWMTESHMRKFNYCPFCGARMDGEE